jgi:hypothetical protein
MPLPDRAIDHPEEAVLNGIEPGRLPGGRDEHQVAS